MGARGLWIDMLCFMHQGSDYGHLEVNHKVILPPNLARMVGSTLPEVEGWLHELEMAGVFSKSEGGTIYSRRMIRDEKIRESRASGGILGGNPALKKVNLPPNLPPTPSSSSSSSSSIEWGEYTPPNAPSWEKCKDWLRLSNKNGSDYTEAELKSAFLSFQANGWMWGKNPVGDYRAALESRIQKERKDTADKSQRYNGNGSKPTKSIAEQDIERLLRKTDKLV